MDLVRNDLAILATDWNVNDAGLGHPGIRKILLAVKSDLVVQDDDVFAFEPFSDVFFALTNLFITLAHLETHD